MTHIQYWASLINESEEGWNRVSSMDDGELMSRYEISIKNNQNAKSQAKTDEDFGRMLDKLSEKESQKNRRHIDVDMFIADGVVVEVFRSPDSDPEFHATEQSEFWDVLEVELNNDSDY